MEYGETGKWKHFGVKVNGKPLRYTRVDWDQALRRNGKSHRWEAEFW